MDVFTLIGRLTLEGADAVKSQLQGLDSYIENHAKQIKAVGMGLTAFGGAVTAALGYATKAAIDEEVNINRMAIALKNVGVAYDDVKDSLEAVITATQRKTGIADNEQRDALNELLLITGDYNTALKWLPLTLDLAAAKQMDFSSAAVLMGRAAIGNTELLGRYGIVIEQGASSAEIFAAIQEKVAGAAEATANPLNILKAEVGDLAETVGGALVPILKSLLDKIAPIIGKIKDWITEHPRLSQVIIIGTAVLGGLSLAFGTILLLLPSLSSALAIFGISLQAALGPIGWISLAITALVAIGALLIANWDSISAWCVKVWNGIKEFFVNIWEKIRTIFSENWDKILAILFPAVGLPILIARHWDEIKDWIKGLWDKVTEIISGWWENIKNFFKKMNPWEWMKKGWEDLSNGIKGIFKGLFGSGFISEWADSVHDFLSSYDLGGAGKSMFGSFVDAATGELKEFVDMTVQAAAAMRAAGVGGVTSPGSQHVITGTTYNDIMAGFGLGTPEEVIASFKGLAGQNPAGLYWSHLGIVDLAPYAPYLSKEALRTLLKWYFSFTGAPTSDMMGTNLIEYYLRELGGYQHGGTIREPTLLTSLRTMRPYAVAGEAGVEHITPGGKAINIFVELDGRIIAQAIGQPLVDEIRLRTGIRR